MDKMYHLYLYIYIYIYVYVLRTNALELVFQHGLVLRIGDSEVIIWIVSLIEAVAGVGRANC